MSYTDISKFNPHPRRVMSYTDIGERMVEYLEDSHLRHSKTLMTGPKPINDPDRGGWYTTVTISDGTTAGTIDLTGGDGGIYGTDGTGHLISVQNGDDRIDEVPFQNTGAVTYYVAVATCEQPVGISVDVETGLVYYDRHIQQIGLRAEPTAAAVAGAGIDLTIANHIPHASDNFATRTAIVFLKNPVSLDPDVAIEEVTITGSGATSKVTTVGDLGQTVVSTDPDDYEVIMIGPIVTRASSYQTIEGWAFVGTVVGGAAPRTYDISGQVSLVPMGDLSTQSSRLLTKGWIDAPTFSVGGGGANISVTSTGTVFVNGRIRNTVTAGPFGTLGVSSDAWLVWDDGLGTFAVYNSWDNANASGRVPLVWARTDGASLALTSRSVGRSIEEFPDTNVITVGTQASHHAMFTSLESALIYALSIQKGSTISPRGITIEIIGDVTVSAAISDTRFFELEWITIRGRGGRPEAGGSRIIWTHDGGLFELNASTSIMRGWAFEDIVFTYDATATNIEAAVIRNTAGATNSVSFRRCIVDGNPATTSAFGGEGGSLPHFLYSDSTNGGLVGIAIDECAVFTTNTMIYVDAAGQPTTTLRVSDTGFLASGTPLATQEGWIVDEATAGGQSSWRIRGCSVSARAVCISVYEISGLRITDCELSINADDNVISIGNSSYTGIADVFIHDNKIDQNYSGGSATANVVMIRAADASGTAAGIFIHDNLIVGDSSASSAKGLFLSVSGTDLNGLVIHSNVIDDVDRGIELDTAGAGVIVSPIIANNFILAGDEAIILDGSNAAQIANNHFGGDADFQDNDHVIVGNYITGPFSPFGSGQANIILVGNRIDDSTALTFQHSRGSIVGNIIDATDFDLGASSTDIAAIGNRLADATPADTGTGNLLVTATDSDPLNCEG